VSALSLQWFGGEGQVPGICEIPLETFFAANDYLVEQGCRRIVYVGTSKGAEASLLAAVQDPRIEVVIAVSPSSVVWGNIGPGRDGISWPERSSWSLKGIPLPIVPAATKCERVISTKEPDCAAALGTRKQCPFEQYLPFRPQQNWNVPKS
jgi:uncharacterized protein